MGWATYYEKFNLKRYVSKFDLQHAEILDYAYVNFSEVYIAMRSRRTNDVFVVIGFVQVHKGASYSSKEFSEDSGVYWYNCPERILKLLTPATTNYAQHWRDQCWQQVHRRKELTLREGLQLINATYPEHTVTLLRKAAGRSNSWIGHNENGYRFRYSKQWLVSHRYVTIERYVEEKL